MVCGFQLTSSHGDAVAVSFRMPHQILRSQHEIPHHLHGFGILQSHMLLLTFPLVEMLMDQFSKLPPFLPLAHHQGMVSSCDQYLRNVGSGTITVDGRFFVDQCFDEGTIGDDDGGGRAEFEGEDSTVLLSPFCKFEVGTAFGDLVEIADDREGWRTRRKSFGSTAWEQDDVEDAGSKKEEAERRWRSGDLNQSHCVKAEESQTISWTVDQVSDTITAPRQSF